MAESQELENTSIILLHSIEKRILTIRGLKVMLDADLAELYGVTTKRLNEQVRRNQGRFPEDFMFKLTDQEKREVVANCDHLSRLKYSKYLPHAFTEHGAIMAASVLNTSRAVGVSIYVVRAFIKFREILSEHKELALKLAELDKKVAVHDVSIKDLVETIRRLANPSKKKRRRIGFDSDLSLDNKD
jgi:hypothetical protein